MKINTVIFDMDGTVLNTLYDLSVSVNYVLTRFEMPLRSQDEYRRFFGNGIRHAIKCAAPEGTAEEVIDDMLPVFREHYDMHCLDNTRPYDGIPELMRQLKGDGYKIAIVSNKIDSAVKELHGRFFSDSVDVAIGERKGIRRKPAPDMVTEALRLMGSVKEEAIYVGDSEVDIQTADNSGLGCISVLWGFRDIDTLKKNGAKLLAETPGEVFEILKRL